MEKGERRPDLREKSEQRKDENSVQPAQIGRYFGSISSGFFGSKLLLRVPPISAKMPPTVSRPLAKLPAAFASCSVQVSDAQERGRTQLTAIERRGRFTENVSRRNTPMRPRGCAARSLPSSSNASNSP